MPSAIETNAGGEQANLHTLKFSSLLEGDQDQLANLLSACENDGFFYLDVRNWKDGAMVWNLDATGRIMKEWFEQPLDEKLKTETLSDAHGQC